MYGLQKTCTFAHTQYIHMCVWIHVCTHEVNTQLGGVTGRDHSFFICAPVCMYVCMYVCMCVCAYGLTGCDHICAPVWMLCVYLCVCLCVCLCECVRSDGRLYVFMYVCMYVCYMSVKCKLIYEYLRSQTHVCMCIHRQSCYEIYPFQINHDLYIYIYIYMYIYIYIYI
jgi:hypothetical protein